MVVKNKVCKECGRLTKESDCPVCGSQAKLLEKYKGMVLVFNAKESMVAEKLSITDNGIYALKY